MSRPRSITDKQVQQFMQLCSEGMTQAKAAKTVGASVLRLVQLSKEAKAGVQGQVGSKVYAKLSKEDAASKTQKEWSEELNVSQSAISKAIRRLGTSSKYSRARQFSDRKVEECRQILDHVKANGGYIQPTIKELGLKTDPKVVRDFAKRIGLDLSQYQFAWSRFGDWLTIPGSWVRQKANYLVPAICLACGAKHSIVLGNARSGKSQTCKSCETQKRGSFSVLNTETGEQYHSLRDWARSIDRLSSYQSLRHRIKKHGQVDICGVKYVLQKEDTSNQ